jgi:hypothetical protein
MASEPRVAGKRKRAWRGVSIAGKVYDRLRERCKRDGVPIAQVVTKLIDDAIGTAP